jgi:CubicO group peptidase (beta-lactamase class C family)
MHQPGERWLYNTGSDVLGVLITRASGQPFETFLRERIFDPLAMKDTGFSVPAEKIERLPAAIAAIPKPTRSKSMTTRATVNADRPPPLPSGAGGWSRPSTDYLGFRQMMLNKGRYAREASCRGLRSSS